MSAPQTRTLIGYLGKDRETPPPMKDTKEIDRLIGEKGKTPYMEEVEDFPDHEDECSGPGIEDGCF